MENRDLIEEMSITALEQRVEFSCCGGGGGSGGDGGPGDGGPVDPDPTPPTDPD